MPPQKSGPAPPTPGRVSLPLGLTTTVRGSPFQGISKTHAPAANTRIPNLTAHVALAKAHQQLLAQGGLLTAPQRKAQASAAAQILKSHATAPTKAAPPPKSTQRIPQSMLPASAKTTAKAPRSLAPLVLGAPPAPPLVQAPQRTPAPASPTLLPTGSRGAPTFNQIRAYADANPAQATTGHPGIGNALASAAHKADLGFGTGAVETMKALGIGGQSTPSILWGDITGNPTIKTPDKWVTSTKASSILQNTGLNLPRIIPSVDLVAPAGAATKSVTPQQLAAVGLSPAQTKVFNDKALKLGWHKQELQGLVGLDLIKHAYSKPPNMLARLAKNFASDVITTGSLPSAVVGIGQEAASGHIGRAASQLGGVVGDQVGGFLQDPLAYSESHPYYAESLVGGVGKTLGEAGRLVPGEGAQRLVNLASTPTRAPLDRGVRSKNLYTASGQLASDVLASKSPRFAKHLEAGQVDNIVRSVTNHIAPDHVAAQIAYAHGLKAVNKQRAEVLSAYQHAGGQPGKILAHYERQTAIDGPKSAAAGQVKFWRDRVIPTTKTLSEKDHQFLSAHAGVANNTSAALVTADRFGETAAQYRAHEPLIISSARAGDPLAQHVMKLREEYMSPAAAKLDDTQYAALEGAYSQAVDEFAQQHLAGGGAAPVRVAYTPPPPFQRNPFTPGPGSATRFTDRFARQKASTGEAFTSGQYLIDPTVPVRENIHAQRMRTSLGAHQAVMEQLGTAATAGDVLPEGHVFVSDHNARALRRLQNDLQDNPVGAHDYYHQEAETRSQFAHALEGATKKPIPGQTWSVPRGEKGTFIPEGAWNRVMDYTRPTSRSVYDKAIKQYQRVLISLFPSTLLGNSAGSIPMALYAGAGPKDFAMAARAIRDPSLVPHTLRGAGVSGVLSRADAHNPLTKYMGGMMHLNRVGEDFSRYAANFAKSRKPMIKGAREANMAFDEYARGVAKGDINPELQNKAIDWAIKFTGDMSKPEGKLGRRAGQFILFHNWLGHVAKLMLYTLPIEHPRRMAFINALSQYGDQYRKEHGAWPSWMQDFLPLFQHVIGKNAFTRVVGLGQASPQNTIGGFLDTLTQPQPIASKLGSLLSPPLAVGVNYAQQELKNQLGNTKPVDMNRFLASQLAYQIPGISKFKPRTGMAPDSIPFVSEKRKTYTGAGHKTAWNPNTVPWDQRPGARPVGGVLGDLSRVFGLPLYDVPNQGPINDLANAKEKKYDAPKTKKWGG